MQPKMQGSKFVKAINRIVSFAQRVGRVKNRINQRMENKYSPSLIALWMTTAAALLIVLMLFVPNYLGVADDGSLSRVMQSAGVYYTQADAEDPYNDYFIKTYSNVPEDSVTPETSVNSQVLIIKAAVFLDNLVTKDNLFDIRFLALIYVLFYIPAFYMIIRQACMRVRKFSEGIVIGIAGLLLFSDIAYITYFNSFYPEAVWFISLMYCVGAALSFQSNRSAFGDFGSLLTILAAGTVLTFTRSQSTIVGILLAVFCLKLVFARNSWKWGIVCISASFFLAFISIAGMINLDSDFDETSRFHAMTRGVLFESERPGDTLEEFGIDSSYEMLTDVSAYDSLPMVQADNPALKEGFLDKYTSADIAGYYLRHPGSFVSMLDVAVKSCFGIRRDYCGNYEQSVGLPGRARSMFWGAWSMFKNNSAPRTIGFLVVLAAAVFLLFGRGYSLRPNKDRRSMVFIDMLMVVLLVCLTQAGVTIIQSGDAQMARHCFLVSYGMDIMIYFVFSEIVHKINIF